MTSERHFSKLNYRISGTVGDKRMFWNTKIGWVEDPIQATLFTNQEAMITKLPDGVDVRWQRPSPDPL